MTFQNELAQMLRRRREKIEELARKMRERITVQKVDKFKLSLPLSVAGIDGGYALFDELVLPIVAIRAVGVVMEMNPQSPGLRYFPEGYLMPELFIADGEDETSVRLISHAYRVMREVETALRVAEEFEGISVLFLHGPLYPHFLKNTKLSEGFEVSNKSLSELYSRVTELLASLLSKADMEGFVVAGVVEDSRGRTYMESVLRDSENEAEEINDDGVQNDAGNIPFISDTELLDAVLEEGEYTAPVSYVQSKVIEAIGRVYPHLQPHLRRSGVFYLKATRNDSPLRVEVYPGSKSANEAAMFVSKVICTTILSHNYGMPAVLVEADRRARIPRNEANMFLYSALGKNVIALRKRRKKRFV